MIIINGYLKFGVAILLCICIAGCSEKRTTDAHESYKFWSGKNPDKNIKVIHGQYWQSASLTKEYIAYLELQTSSKWIEEFDKQNHLVATDSISSLPDDAPAWFKPQKNSHVFKAAHDENSVYFEDFESGRIFIFEQQL